MSQATRSSRQSKLFHRPWKDKEGRQAFQKQILSDAISGLRTIAEIVNQVTDTVDVGPPGLKTGLTGLIYVLDAIQKTSQNISSIEQLSLKIQELLAMLDRSKKDGTLSSPVGARISRLSDSLNEHIQELDKIVSRSYVKRMVHRSEDEAAINDHIQAITWSLQSLTVESLLSIEFALDEHSQFMRTAVTEIKAGIVNVGDKVDKGNERIEYKLDVRDGHPPHTFAAQFNCGDRASCWEGTRVDIINEINEWADGRLIISTDSPTACDEPSSVNFRVFWINGSAGTGKTTIAYTMAVSWDLKRILGASFFCSRDDAACSNPKLIFPSIAYQLGRFCHLFREEVSKAVKAHPEIGYSSLSHQLEKLIVNPLITLGESFPSCMVVIDALDECKDSGTTSEILAVLARYVKQLSKIRILLTSRPDKKITPLFESKTLQEETRRLVLHEVHLNLVQKDIDSYIAAKLAETRTIYHLDLSWPPERDVHALSRLSSGLFIFAATSIRFIEDRNSDDPKGQLKELLRGRYLADASSPYRHLDELYTQVFDAAYPTISYKLAGRLRMVLGSILHLQDPLSACNLEDLLGVDRTDSDYTSVQTTLMRLHSVVLVPENDGQIIRLLHPSFFDFLTNGDRCRNTRLLVNPQAQHTLLAKACLRVMCSTLKRNIIGSPNQTTLNAEIENLPERITQNFPPFLQYACRHWSSHLANAKLSDDLLDILKRFVETNLLHWVEVCSVLGELRSTVIALNSACEVLSHTPGQVTSDALNMLRDGGRFVLEYFPILSRCCQQVYSSALLFAPSDTFIRTCYMPKFPQSAIQMGHYSRKLWGSNLSIFQGHSRPISSVAFSSDGTRIVSGSGDWTVRLWDAVSGSHLKTFEGHSDSVASVAFSPDDTRIVSGSVDKTIRLWDLFSGALLHKLEGHLDYVESVSFSTDGRRIVSGSGDETIRLWDVVSGADFKTLEGHSVRSVAFSSDNTRIVSGSKDNTISIWDAVSGAHLKMLEGHSSFVKSVIFSSDGTRIASGSRDHTIRLWDAVSGTHLKTLEGHSGVVSSVMFSPDDTRIVSGSWDHTIRLWDAASGVHLSTFNGHLSDVNSIAFSPDGTRIVSGSWDCTVRLWDATSGGMHIKPTEGYKGTVDSILFSTDGTRIASSSDDSVVQLWDGVSGAHLRTLKGHSGGINSIIFSPDSTRIASASSDSTIRLWEIVSGAHLSTLTGHSDSVVSVTYSPDGTLIASGSWDCTARIWDAISGTHLRTFEGHSKKVYSVAFSPDSKHIASGSMDDTIQMWDAASGAHLKTLGEQSGLVTSALFSLDGTRLASRYDVGNVRLWDTVSGDHLDTRDFSGGTPSILQFSLDDDIPRIWGAVADPEQNMEYFIGDGWINLYNPRRRVCWIPSEYRNAPFASWGNRVVLWSNLKRGLLFLTFKDIDM